MKYTKQFIVLLLVIAIAFLLFIDYQRSFISPDLDQALKNKNSFCKEEHAWDYWCEATAKRDESLCYNYPDMKEFCLLQVKLIKHDEGLAVDCNDLSNEHLSICNSVVNNQSCTGNCILHDAVINNDVEVCKRLSPLVNIQNCEDLVTWHQALVSNDKEVCKKIIGGSFAPPCITSITKDLQSCKTVKSSRCQLTYEFEYAVLDNESKEMSFFPWRR